MSTSDKRELTFLAKLVDGISRPLKKIGDQAEDTKDDLEEVNQGLKKLDEKTAATTKTLEGLRKEVGRTGDLDLVKDIAKQEARLKALERQRKSLVGDGGREAEQFALSFSSRIGPLLASAPISPPMGAAFAAASPVVASTVSAAVTAGVGLAVTGAGVKLAFQDPAVKQAAEGLKTEIGASLKDAARPFVPETIRSIGIVRSEFRALKPEIDGLFADSARYVAPLTRAVTGFARETIPGLREANRNAEPLIETLGEHGPKAGAAFGAVLRSLSQDSDTTAQSLDGLLTSIEGTLVSTSKMVELANKAYPYLGPGLLPWIGAMGDSDDKAKKAADSAGDLGDQAKSTGEKAAVAAGEVKTLSQEMDELSAGNLDAQRAAISFEQAVDEASAAVKENGKTLDINTAKGQENKTKLLEIADTARRHRDAILASGAGQETATAAMERGRVKFIAAAGAMGMGERKARDLAAQLFGIPRNVSTTVTANTKAAQAAISSLNARIASIDRRIDIKAKMTVSYGGGAHTGQGYSTGYSQGGPVHGPGPKGVDSRPALLAPGEHVVTADEVDAAGGHAAIERWRRQLRSGTRASGSGTGAATTTSAGPAVVQFRSDGTRLGELLLEMVRHGVQVRGGNVQVVLGG